MNRKLLIYQMCQKTEGKQWYYWVDQWTPIKIKRK